MGAGRRELGCRRPVGGGDPELRADTYGQVVLPFEAATVLSPLAQIVNVPAAVATYV